MSLNGSPFQGEGGIYVHTPFCRNKCLYCDFYTGGLRIADWEKFVAALENEIGLRKSEIDFRPSTLYLGGGTPSLIPVQNFSNLISIIEKETGVGHWKEFSLEVNPEDVTEEKIEVWKEAGVNRISMGVQSFNDRELALIGRQHDARKAETAFKLLKSCFSNVSVDIMFGIPGQTVESYRNSLEKVLELGPSHISSYSLMLEEGTAMTHLVNKNKIPLPLEYDWLQMFELTTTFLPESGYERYEISNYSLPGKESRHNLSYWEGKPYLGLGPGAHSYDGRNTRRANKNDIKGYLKHFSSLPNHPDPDRRPHFYEEEKLSEIELREEMIMTRLRNVKGLDLREFESQFGKHQTERLMHSVQKFIKTGEMKATPSHVSFTSKGFLLSDSILSYLI